MPWIPLLLLISGKYKRGADCCAVSLYKMDIIAAKLLMGLCGVAVLHTCLGTLIFTNKCCRVILLTCNTNWAGQLTEH